MSKRIEIQPEMLLWAAERSGLTIDNLSDIFPKAVGWIKNESLPTIKQLEHFAKKLHIPFGYLFLKEIPQENLPITFFRSNGDIVNDPPLVVKDLVNSLKSKQDWIIDYLAENDYEPLSFIGLLKDFSNYKVEDAADTIRKKLFLDVHWFLNVKKSNSFRYWIDQIEKNRIIVISTGYLGNNKRTVQVDVCKGFTLVNEYCPFIYINTNNLGGGRIFTLIHELVHIFVGRSLGTAYNPIEPSSDPLEKFCDSVASEILVPKIEFLKKWQSLNGSFSERVDHLSTFFCVSKLVILKKSLDTNLISKSHFWEYYNQYTTNFNPIKQSGGDYWNSKPYEVSRRFYNYVDTALNQGKLLATDAYKLTNMKGNTYANFRNKA